MEFRGVQLVMALHQYLKLADQRAKDIECADGSASSTTTTLSPTPPETTFSPAFCSTTNINKLVEDHADELHGVTWLTDVGLWDLKNDAMRMVPRSACLMCKRALEGALRNTFFLSFSLSFFAENVALILVWYKAFAVSVCIASVAEREIAASDGERRV